ncbi:MFS transporter [Thermoflavimicrobium dichotomicum]|uniref:Predicted arabinose efflux permease, MFS family n=1 Tax=Thermoflavimicrobium dichotomicum TaxID=46223 RepID=A0A1I3NMD9_9BACL|nr:MFS transporter [Thermoflavimicrobium dichotomicum]SFJ10464.1 Predicted arabinose efflux permease, MFS family [Thermoflavimicrobium dichotomicum]
MRKKHSFSYLWTGQSLANLGDAFYTLALVTIIYQSTHSTFLAALLPIIRTVFTSISGLLAPLILDRFSLKHILIISQFGQTIFLLGLVWLSTYPVTLFLTWIWFFIAILAFLDGWTKPARNSLIPRLVEKTKLVKANSFISTTDNILLLAGWSLGGMAVAAFGARQILWGTLSLFVISTLSLLFIMDPEEKEHMQKENNNHLATLKEGWSIILSHPVLSRMAIGYTIMGLSFGVWSGAILLTFVNKALHQNEAWWGFINSSYFAGTIMGGIVTYALSKWIEKHLVSTIIAGSIVFSVFTFVFAGISVPILSLILVFLTGPPFEALLNASRTIIQTSTSPAQLPKVNAAYFTLDYVSFGLSTLLMGTLADLMEIRMVYVIAALLSAMPALLLIPVRKYEYKTFDQI